MLIAHAFWSANKEGKTPELPIYTKLGLESAVSQFDRVYLWQFEDVPNAPDGVIKRDASILLSIDERNALMTKHVTIAHVSDVVRFLAAAMEGGWVIDADNIWLRRPPSGFVFTTLWAKRTGA